VDMRAVVHVYVGEAPLLLWVLPPLPVTPPSSLSLYLSLDDVSLSLRLCPLLPSNRHPPTPTPSLATTNALPTPQIEYVRGQA
jgi:hypothetical protein